MVSDLTSHRLGDSDYIHRSVGTSRRVLATAVFLTLVFACVEVAGGYLSNSLALLSDAGHMLTDSASLFFALVASFLASRPASARFSFGLAKIEIIAAFFNAIMMLVVVAWIVVEAIGRFYEPQQVHGASVFIVALIGLTVNIAVAWTLSRDSKNINTKAALLHAMGDLLGSIAAIAAGLIVFFGGPSVVDPILSIFVSLLILKSAVGVLSESTRLLLDGVPAEISYEKVGSAISEIPQVCSVHDLHIWDMSSGKVALSAHVAVRDLEQWPDLLAMIRERLEADFSIKHITLQPEKV